MSLDRLNPVWRESKAKGNALLLLLAIADCADPCGFAFPGIEYLMKRTRLSRRSVINHVADLEKTGELKVYRREGMHNSYIVEVGLTESDRKQALEHMAEKCQVTVEICTGALYADEPVQDLHGGSVETCTGTSANSCTRSVNGSVKEPEKQSIPDGIDVDAPSSAEVAPVQVVEPQGSESPEPPAPESPAGPDLPPTPPTPTAFPDWATEGLNPYQLQQLEELPVWLKTLICQEPTQQTLFGAICLTQQWDVATLTDTRKKEVGAVAAELLKAGAKPINLPSFWNWLKAKSTAENWNSVTINAMKKFWPDFARELAKPDNKWVPYRLAEHPPETPQMFYKRAQMVRDLLLENRVEEANQIGYDDVVAALQQV